MPLWRSSNDVAVNASGGDILQLLVVPAHWRSMGYFPFGTVKIEGHPEATAGYIWGDKTLRTIHCKSCGCVTHWEPLNPEAGGKHGVNLGNFDPELIKSVRVRQFDGASTWKFIDQQEADTRSD